VGTSLAAEPLLSLAATVTSDQHVESVLRNIVQGLASQPGVALTRIWLLPPADLPGPRQAPSDSPERTGYLRLAASAGTPANSPGEDWSFLQGRFSRISFNVGKVGEVAANRNPILIKDLAAQNDWIVRPEWAKREGIRSFAGHPLIFRDELLGVIGIFSRNPLVEQEFTWLGLFANQAAIAIANARAFEEVHRLERQLRQIVDAIPQMIAVLSPDGTPLYVNQTILDYTGLTIKEVMAGDFRDRAFHSEDVARLRSARLEALSRCKPFENEQRVLRKDGQYRWFLIQYKPLHDEQERVIRWYATGTDIDDRVRAEERTRNENLALREQIERDSMFEDVVGSSDALNKVLHQLRKVAASDSTVLILGETGTGKELIARAIHKRSGRAARAFIAVNCAAIPASLIASELFGHEKGAFTGATHRRLGRFEAASGGTIFLDEVGDLPPEVQIALLRVLQEREIERVGSDRPIPVDVRVLAATHRNLEKLVSEGEFRRDLLYRLNVVPIHMPSLRERAADIPLLVEYFIARFGRKVGKKFRAIDKKALQLLKEYEWPGNIRELQNVIERAVILSDSDTFAVDETWLKGEPTEAVRPATALNGVLLKQEKEMIEAALAECRGRVSGPTGAASKLGLPTRTLDSKIKRLGIDKHRFKSHAG
jgi:formate hydrogenlyase transcriptional activator